MAAKTRTMRGKCSSAAPWSRASGKPPGPFLAANHKTIRKVEELEHKSRRQDVLVDDALDLRLLRPAHIPDGIFSGATLTRGTARPAKRSPQLLRLSKDELMRHEAAGITTDAFPKLVRLGGVDCAASYL